MCSPYTLLKKGGGNPYPVPCFEDLGKQCRDLFDKHYNLGKFRVSAKNKTCHGVDITTTGVHKAEDKTAKGEVNVKADYPFILKGLSSSHKWDTDNILKNEIILQDILCPGSKVSTEFRLDGEKISLGGKLKIQQKHQFFTADIFVDGADDPESALLLGGTLVTGYNGMMAAYKIDYDQKSGELKGNNLGIGYNKKDYSFFLVRDNNKSIVEGFFHHRVSPQVEVGCQAKVGEEGGTEFGIAGKYMFNGYGHTLRGKVNNKSMLGLGLELKVIPGWQAFAGTEVDLKKFSEGNHKIGFGMDFGYE